MVGFLDECVQVCVCVCGRGGGEGESGYYGHKILKLSYFGYCKNVQNANILDLELF